MSQPAAVHRPQSARSGTRHQGRKGILDNRALIGRLCLGSVQFGMPYGVSNTRGQVSEPEVFEILAFAREMGIESIDTASAYGTAEDIIGRFHAASGRPFDVITKIPALDGASGGAERFCRESLRRLQLETLEGVLAHKASDYLTSAVLRDELARLRDAGVVRKIGVSVYRPEQLERMFDAGYDADMIQLPYNVFDRRFAPYFAELQTRGVEIWVRSVFLQGAVFLDEAEQVARFPEITDQMQQLRRTAARLGTTVANVCLHFVLGNPAAHRGVIGVDSLEQLRGNVAELVRVDAMPVDHAEIDGLECRDERVLIPSNWS